jgi:hypothetical protein
MCRKFPDPGETGPMDARARGVVDADHWAADLDRQSILRLN